MSDPFFAALDIGLVFALALGLWQLVSLKRGMRRDREAAARAEPPPGPEQERR